MSARVLELRSSLAVALPGDEAHPPEIGSTHTDMELVVRAREGDRWAKEALYRRHVRDVTRVALRLLARRHEAEDVVQDAFVIALRELHTLTDESAFGAWLMRIVIHQAHRRFRRRALARLLGLDRGEDDATLAQQIDPGAGPDIQSALMEIDRVLASLAPRKIDLRKRLRRAACALLNVLRAAERAERWQASSRKGGPSTGG